jgi:uncharacterized protein DUF6023
LTALLLLAGATWWWRAAPDTAADSRLMNWRLSTEQLLPDTGEQEAATTLALQDGAAHEEVAEVDGSGEFLISVVCAGEEGSRVRVSLGGDETGRGVRCSGARTPEVFSVGLVTELHLRISVEAAGPVVFRYTLQRMNS